MFPAHATKDTNWPTYANDAGSSKYTPINKIDADNANQLKTVWTWDSPDNLIVRENRQLTPWGFKSTPIKIDNILYISTSLGQVAAISADQGRTIWNFDTKSYEDGRPTNLGFNHRGVAYWTDGISSAR